MMLLDEHYPQYPCEGKIKRAQWLPQEVGYRVGKRRIKRLMEVMELETFYPKPNTNIPSQEYTVYPYLLRDIDITKPNQVWAADHHLHPDERLPCLLAGDYGLVQPLCDSMGAFSPTLEAEFCVEALRNALLQGRCEIFNTDQGAQFTSRG